MARTEGDSWDLASSVGATATMVAAGRAIASADPRGLINDPFAAPLVRAVGLEFFTRMLDGDVDLTQIPGGSPERVQGTEYAPGIMDFDADRASEMSAPLREVGLDIDMSALAYSGERSHVIDYLRDKGWRVTGAPRDELFTRFGLTVPAHEDDDPLGEIVYFSATLGG